MGVQRVLDGQRVQPERLGDVVELVLGGLVQPDPDEVAGLGGELATRRVARRQVVDDPLALAVHGAVDDHGAHASPGWTPYAATTGLRLGSRTWQR